MVFYSYDLVKQIHEFANSIIQEDLLMANKLNREHKSTLFASMFSDKKNALDLYNALNESHYDNPDEIMVTTLENAIFINRYNDVSYILDWTLNLYEHQSTYNPNMPLRSLFYISETYERIIETDAIYGSRLVRIPTPKVVVFYNGKAEQPDRQYLKLSDAFANKSVQGDLELTVLMLNINHSHNVELMNKSEALRGYSVYISKFREYNEMEDISAQKAAVMALDYCVNNNIMATFFKEHRKEVIGMVLDFTEERASEFIGKLEKEIEEKQQYIDDKTREIENKNKEIENKDREIENKDREIENKNKQIEQMSRILEEHGITLQE